jgi:GNAT superfamily N-acetyltransferase
VTPPPLPIRRAVEAEIDALAALINRAFVVERFFLEGERTDAAQIGERMRTGTFLVAHEPGAPERIAGTVYVERRTGDRAYIGLLSVDPARQGTGVGRTLMAAAEAYASECGCGAAELTVVNLRTELFPFYEWLGYHRAGEEPFPNPSTRPCHLVVMVKPLRRWS